MRGLESVFVESVAVAMICPEPCEIFSSMNSIKLLLLLFFNCILTAFKGLRQHKKLLCLELCKHSRDRIVSKKF